MTTTPTAPSPAPAQTALAGHPHVTFARLVRSEQIKFWTVRSTVWVLGITAVVIVGLMALFAAVATNHADQIQDRAHLSVLALDPGVTFAQLAVAVLGVLTITGEYSTGMIRSSLSAAPRRTPVLWSKLLVLFVTILVVAAVAVVVALAVEWPILHARGFEMNLSDPQSQRVIVGSVLYLATIAALAYAFGALLRNSAAGLATVLGLLLVFENLFSIPWKPLSYIHPFLPSTAGGKIRMLDSQIAEQNASMHGPDFTAWQGYGVLVAWVALLLGLAIWRLKKRDA